ncbi:Peptide methionine sulfoxide reductase MsrA [Spironucleus salmonicida]|uniref:peptide-methionine (S)-S-oxide reductase n=1 Tax=Spironucleus salmonicida TaxID=348837 RepID=V6LH40_9EUKA|nr:Peptide methionine sulfoxide reductase MsrA [Spironucleus salmonicida]|eukprot:EST43031.1 Peptide methionine sulfoxide reductase MsrA [Spironucleus salmonicida]
MSLYLAAGCFWGVQQQIDLLEEILESQTGYANSATANPTYQQVSTRKNIATECVHVQYNRSEKVLFKILYAYFKILGRRILHQKPLQYKNAIFVITEQDQQLVNQVFNQIKLQYQQPLYFECSLLKNFCLAEDMHQKYYQKKDMQCLCTEEK